MRRPRNQCPSHAGATTVAKAARLSLVSRDPNKAREPAHALPTLVEVPIDFLKLVLVQAVQDLPRR